MLKTIITTVISLILVPTVMLSATHAKDVASYGTAKQGVLGTSVGAVKNKVMDDPMAKALGDLHSHTDKTMLKHNMVKTSTDASVQLQRHESEEIVESHPLSIALLEFILSLRLTFAWALSR